MKRISRLLYGCLTLAAMLPATAHCAIPRHYTVSSIIRMVAGAGMVYDVNSSGQVIGFSSVSGLNQNRGFVWQNGVTTYLSPLGDSWYSYAYAINDDGVVAGYSNVKPVIWQDGTISVVTDNSYIEECRDINMNGDLAMFGVWGVAYAYINGTTIRLPQNAPTGSGISLYINDNGELAGSTSSDVGVPQWNNYHSYYWTRDNVCTQLPFDIVLGITNSGQVLGTNYSGNANYLWQNGHVQNLTDFYASDINNQGLIYGCKFIPGHKIASIWDNGVITDINTLVDTSTGLTFTDCVTASDAGHIVVVGSDNNYYLLTPEVPEPSSIIVLLSGIAGLGGLALRRRK